MLASREATEGDFYLVASRALQLAFGVRWVVTGEIDQDGTGVNTTCMIDRETIAAPFHYELKNGPCGMLYAESGETSVFFDSNLQDRFPLFGIFSDIGAEGYLAQPFHDANGNPVGHCCIMDDQKIDLNEDDLTIFHLIVQRIGAEYRRREAEILARSPAEHMAQFVNSASDWIWATDENDRFTLMEGEVFKEQGFDVSLAIGKTRKDLADLGDLAAEAEKWSYHDATIASREPLRDFSYMRTTPEGGRQIILINGSPHYHPDGRFAGYRGTGRNITEAESVRLDTSLTRQRLDFIISGSGANLWDWNLETEGLWFSRGWITLLGLDERKFHEFRLQDYIHPDDLPEHEKILLRHMKGETEHYSSQLRAKRNDSEWIWLQCTGYCSRKPGSNEAVRFSGQAIDITKLKETEAALKQSEARYELAFKAASEGIWEWNIEPDTVFLSPTLLAILGYEPTLKPASSHTLEERILDEDVVIHRTAIRNYLRGKTPHYECMFRVRTPQDEIKWVRSRGMAEFGPDGRAIRMVGSFADITEIRKKELALNVALEEAEIANRAKIEFLANMSHELRTPLNSIIGFSETIRDQFFGSRSEKYTEYAYYVCDSARHLLDLINDILDVSRIEAGEMPIMESDIIVSDIMASCSRLIDSRVRERRITFSQEIQEDIPVLHADERRMKQIFVNLLANAVKFTDPGGVVSFSCDYTPRKGMSFVITDTGIGIPEENLSSVMEMFRQVDGSFTRNYEGVGLGLPLSKKLAELQGGTLELRSREGVGTTAIVTLPPERCLPRKQ